MIILIDDKKKRHDDFGWTEDKFNKIAHIIQRIYSLEDLESKSKDVFQKGNIVLYHESFLDNTYLKKKAAIKRSQLEEYAKKNSDFYLAIFSGSKSSRSLSLNIAHLPVSIVFQNLGVFSHKALVGDINLKYLLFGDNPEIEEELSLKLDIANKEIDSEPAKISQTQNLFLRPIKGNIQNAIENAEEKILYNDVSDEKLSEKVNDFLKDKEFDNIFIPVCFGPVLSDFNGLRLATHLRCTESPNQFKNIFIYSFVGIEYLVNNEYFNILKTKNVHLIDYKKSAFAEAIQRVLEPLTKDDLPKELNKIKIEPPKNYGDSHSIANEWAIYRWSLAINTSDDDIEKIIKKVYNQLYFKYLRSIYPKDEINIIPEKNLKIEYTGSPKILYIDDEADKGWYEIFCKVIYDINGLDFDYLNKEFYSRTQDEIIKFSIDKISKEDIDLVLLDFRLHPNDFITNNIKEVTGLKLLKEIKKMNPGIQVIMFSATNKIWNLQALQDEGADGFIVKETPENGLDYKFTTQSIESFRYTIEKCLMKCFIKKIYYSIDPIAKLVKNESEKKPSNFSLSIQQQLIQNINQRIEIFNKLIYNYPSNLEWPFSTLILIIEEIVNALYFDDGSDHVVEINPFNNIKCNYIANSERTLSIKPNKLNSNYINEQYVVPENEINYYNKASNRDPFNFRLTCILHYRYGIPLGTNITKYYPLYKLRSNSVMHIGADKVCVSDLELGIELLKEMIK